MDEDPAAEPVSDSERISSEAETDSEDEAEAGVPSPLEAALVAQGIHPEEQVREILREFSAVKELTSLLTMIQSSGPQMQYFLLFLFIAVNGT